MNSVTGYDLIKAYFRVKKEKNLSNMRVRIYEHGFSYFSHTTESNAYNCYELSAIWTDPRDPTNVGDAILVKAGFVQKSVPVGGRVNPIYTPLPTQTNVGITIFKKLRSNLTTEILSNELYYKHIKVPRALCAMRDNPMGSLVASYDLASHLPKYGICKRCLSLINFAAESILQIDRSCDGIVERQV